MMLNQTETINKKGETQIPGKKSINHSRENVFPGCISDTSGLVEINGDIIDLTPVSLTLRGG